jgi:hypothetical protein
MPTLRTLASGSLLVLAACGGSPSHESTTPGSASSGASVEATSTASSGGAAETQSARTDAGSPASADAAPTGSGAINVSGRPPGDNTIDVGGNSDLPPNVPSSMQPYARVIESAVAPIRAALGECVRSSNGPPRRMYRVTVGRDGLLSPRPPQTTTFPTSVLACVDGVIRGTTVNPPPPMTIPYDVYFDVTR